jgi:hypothetical protein
MKKNKKEKKDVLEVFIKKRKIQNEVLEKMLQENKENILKKTNKIKKKNINK